MKWVLLTAVFSLVAGAGMYALWGLPGWGIEAAIERCERQGPYKEKCYDDLIMREARAEGITRGFDILAAIYPRDHDFATFCHGNTHQLGELAFEQFEKGEKVPITPKTSYCGFGFYHGFLEKLVYTRGDLSEARRFCEDVDKQLSGSVSGVSFACYHGIGHGVIDGSDPSRWGDAQKYIAPGLALCEKISDVEEQKARCASGVFNALAIVMHTGQHGFKPDLTDPYSVCKKQTLPYVRKACYDQMNSYIVETTHSFGEALKSAAEHAENAYLETAVSSVASYTAQSALASGGPLGPYLLACSELRAPQNDVCARGFAVGLIEFGDPGKEYTAAIAMCAKGGTRAQACFNGVVTGARERLSSEQLSRVCADIKNAGAPDSGSACEVATEQQ